MTVYPTAIPGVMIIEPRLFPDSRGYFFEAYVEHDFHSLVCPEIRFVQDNESRSHHGVVRGLHFQLPPHSQAKLVRVVEGAIIDIALDMRAGSPTFGQHVAVELSAANHRQLFLPHGMAHGFAVTSESATILYKVDSPYAPEYDSGVSVLDDTLGIQWPFPISDAILSDKDRCRVAFADFATPFRYPK